MTDSILCVICDLLCFGFAFFFSLKLITLKETNQNKQKPNKTTTQTEETEEVNALLPQSILKTRMN